MEVGKENETDHYWRKPGDVMKRISSRRKRIAKRSISTSQLIQQNTNMLPKLPKRTNNPFAKKRPCSESSLKRRILTLSDNGLPENCVASTDTTSDCVTQNSKSVFDLSLFSDDKNDSLLSNNDLGFVYLNEDSIQGIFNEGNKQPESESQQPVESLPPWDWTLKTKARYLSPHSFAWCARMKGSEGAHSITRATRCLPFQRGSETQSDHRIELGKCLVYWQFPTMSWLSLFPRFGSDCKLHPHEVNEPIISEYMKSRLYDSWATAFRSAYQLLRQNLCPYFYVCSQQYTALFRSGALPFHDEICCILTPTSLGFRNSLVTEGIAFTLPLQAKDSSHSDSSKKNATDGDPSNNDGFIRTLKVKAELNCPFPASRCGDLSDAKSAFLPTDDDPTKVSSKNHECEEESEDPSQEIDAEEELSWKDISDCLRFRKSKDVETAITNDKLPNTAVLIEGLCNTQLLFNYLLNCKSSISTSGSQTGIPPTILSPVAFAESALKKLEYRAGIAKSGENQTRLNEKNHKFSLDITGPLMPQHIAGVFSLLNETQEDGCFSAAMATHSHTRPFNASNSERILSESEVEKCAEKCGLPSSNLHQMSCLKPLCLKQVEAATSRYSWSV